jgi:hypothetical protein
MYSHVVVSTVRTNDIVERFLPKVTVVTDETDLREPIGRFLLTLKRGEHLKWRLQLEIKMKD